MLEVQDCKGEIISNKVVVNFKVTNFSNDTNRVFISDLGFAKANGQFACLSFRLGNDSDNGGALVDAYLAPNQSVSGGITYGGVLTNLKTIGSATFLAFNNVFMNGKEIKSVSDDSVQVNDIAIDWAYRRFTPKTYKNLVSIGVGFLGFYLNNNYSASNPVNTSIGYQREIVNSLTVGASISYGSYKYNYKSQGVSFSPFTSDLLYCGATVTYFINDVIKQVGKKVNTRIEPYVGVNAGLLSVRTAKIVTNTSSNKNIYSPVQGNIKGGGFVGVRYLLIKNLYLYGELGYDNLSFLNFGGAFKFN